MPLSANTAQSNSDSDTLAGLEVPQQCAEVSPSTQSREQVIVSVSDTEESADEDETVDEDKIEIISGPLESLHVENVQGYESPDLKTLMMSPLELHLHASPGIWKLSAWIPQSGQGFTKNHRVIGRMTGNMIRQLQITVSILNGRDIKSTDLSVRTTKVRKSITIEVPSQLTLVQLKFETRAMFMPLVFRFSLERLPMTSDQGIPSSSSSSQISELLNNEEEEEEEEEETKLVQVYPERYSIEWLEQRFTRLPIEDKLKFAKVVWEAQKQGWQPLEGASAATYDNSMAIKVMQASSTYKDKAYAAGLIRPFLLLASMHPGRRTAWAFSLNINLVRSSKYGNAHWEAYKILTHSRYGIVARATHTFREKANPVSRALDWYQLLHRVLTVVLSTRRAGPLRIFQKEKMEPELLRELNDAKVGKGVSRVWSQSELAAVNPMRLENVFSQQFLTARAEMVFPNGVFHFPGCRCLSSSGDADHNDEMKPFESRDGDTKQYANETETACCASAANISREQFRDLALNLVESSEELSAKAKLLRKHGFTDDHNIAIAVLSAYKRSALPIAFESLSTGHGDEDDDQVCAAWNPQWGSQAHLYDIEFQETVRAKMRQESSFLQAQTIIGTAVPIILASLAITPGAVAAIVLARTAVKRVYKDVPASLAGILAGLVMERYWLAMSDIGVEQFYD